MSTSKSRHTVLTEDGELREIEETPATSSQAAVFCTNCGTANHASSRFCRSCGQSLEEQFVNPASLDSYAPPQQKGKRLAMPEPRSMQASSPSASATAGKVIVEVMTMIIMGSLGLAAALTHADGFVIIAILVAWLLIEAVRHGVMGGHR